MSNELILVGCVFGDVSPYPFVSRVVAVAISPAGPSGLRLSEALTSGHYN